MGLDMYLSKKTYIGNQYKQPEQQVSVIIPENQKDVTFPVQETIKQNRITYIQEEVGYWRKANHIHNWFVENVQDGEDDCREYEVSEDDLTDLLNLCKQVIENKDKADELLPSINGFFFGSTEYDEWYFQQCQDTINIIENILKEKGEKGYLDGEIYYNSSW